MTVVRRPLRLALDRKAPADSGQSRWNRIWHGDNSVYSAGRIDAYACAACGYTELYTCDLDELRHNPDSGVHLLEPPA